MSARVGRSIGLVQALVVLLSSLVIGLALSAAQVAYTLTQQRDTATELVQDVLTSAEGGATNAAWTLDSHLARNVIDDVMVIRGVHFAELLDEQGQVLAAERKPELPRGWLVSWLVETFIADVPRSTKTLEVEHHGEPLGVGTFTIEFTPFYVADNVLGVAAATIVMTFVGALLIGLVLLAVSSRLITIPLERAAATIARIDPENAGALPIPVPRIHRNNELGQLLAHTNDMLARLKASHDELEVVATRDGLTGLSNRTLIRERLVRALSRARRDRHLVAVLFLDLDRFKNVNDSLGHDVGDELLKAVANKLRRTIRANDAIGRLGGDEFLIVLDGIEHLEEVVATVRRIVDSLACSYSIGNHEVRASASIGISVYPTDGSDAGTLMRHADLAMYKAKHGGTPWFFFSRELSERVGSRLKVETALVGALAEKEFHLFFQPKFDAPTGTLSGCEALLRWKHEGRWVPAGEFITVVEDMGMIGEVGDWVIDEACRQVRRWGDRAVPVAVNVSARQLGDPRFVDRFLDSARRHGVSTRLLEIEITETALMEDLDCGFEMLSRLRDAGVAVSIDDFGTGYSSLSYLSRLPITFLKIDRSFVSGSRRSRIMLSTIIAMSRALGIRTVAEGVESVEQRAEVVERGCDLLQGYFTGHPVPVPEFDALYLEAAAES
jgi:diguanylate cyclase (GGDEF)-like protein